MSSTSELGINLGNLQAYIMLLPTLRMIGFILPPANEIYHYMNDNELQAFLDIIASEIDRYFGKTFTAEQLDAFNYPCYRFIAKDMQDVSATLPDGLFRLFLDKTLTYKHSGGGLNLRNSNKYATAEFASSNVKNVSMRGGELDAATMEAMNAKSDADLIAQLRELKNGTGAAKEEFEQYLTHLGSNPATHERLTRIRRALGIANGPSSAAAVSANASKAQNAIAPSNRQISVPKVISSHLVNYLPSDITPDAKLAITSALVQLGEDKAFGLMEYAGYLGGKKISMIGGGQIIFVGNNGSTSQIPLDNALKVIASRRVNAKKIVEDNTKATYLLGHIRAQEQFFIKIREEMTRHKGENIIAALRNFFEEFKPSMLDAVAFAQAEKKYIDKIKEKQRKLISEYSMFSSTYIKNENLNAEISSVQQSYNIRRCVFGGAGAVSSIGGAVFHLYRRGYASAVGRVTGWTKAPPPPPPTQSASRPQRFQEEGKMTQKCTSNQHVVLKPGGVANYGTIDVEAQPARTEQICTPGALWGQSCKQVTTEATLATTRPRTVAEAGGALPQNPASELQCLDIVCVEGLRWNNNKQDCEAVACPAEQAFVQTGIDPKTLDGTGVCQLAKAPRMGEEISWGQFAYSFLPFTGEVRGKQVPCDQAGPTNLQCWSSWVQNKQIDIGRGLGSLAGYTFERGGEGIQFAVNAFGVTGDLGITGALVHGTRRSVEWTYRGWKQFESDKSEIEEMKDFVIEMNKIKTQLNEQIEIATFQFMVAQFFKYILPQIQELKLGLTTKITLNNKGNPTKNKNGKIIREEFVQGTPEADEANERMLAYLSTMISISKMDELWDKLKLQEKYEKNMQRQFGEPRPAGLLTGPQNAAEAKAEAKAAAEAAAEAEAASQAAVRKLSAKDWFELFLPHFMSSILRDLQQEDTKGEAGSTLMERVKRTIARNIKERNNSQALQQIRILEGQLKETITGSKGVTGFEEILKKYETITKGRGSSQIAQDFNYVVSCFESVGQSYKARQEAAAAAAALQKQKEETDKMLAAKEAKAVKNATRDLEEKVKVAERERNAAQRERNAVAAQRERNAAAQRERNAAAQRERNAAARAVPPPANARVAPAAPPAARANNNTAGGQIRNRETRRGGGGKRKVNRKTRRSRKH